MIYRSGDNVYLNFDKYGPLCSFYLELIEGRASFIFLRELNAETDKLKKENKKTVTQDKINKVS